MREYRDGSCRWTEADVPQHNEPVNETIELHFVTCLFHLGPKAHDQNDLQYAKAVKEWWIDHVGTAGCAWYAAWFVHWCNRRAGERDTQQEERYHARMQRLRCSNE